MKFLIDEMFSAATAERLVGLGHDAVHVYDVGLSGAPDALVADAARSQDRAVVTENVQDFAAESDVMLLFVLKKRLPAGSAQAPALAKILDRWTREHPDPYLGEHWPAT